MRINVKIYVIIISRSKLREMQLFLSLADRLSNLEILETVNIYSLVKKNNIRKNQVNCSK